ncbi:MAG: hypothetical protein NW224_25355 [Leptolyngbyaceae cyanobacterium bins.302]|nr:hypothetical protein [Leptolyngbyaceae cyanobacterium bins.302]
MRPHRSQSPIRPQISTMPRPQTEAAAYLNIYKLVTERKRLEQELELLNQRRDRISQRLEVLQQQTSALEDSVHQIRDQAYRPVLKPEAVSTSTATSESQFDTFYLEY